MPDGSCFSQSGISIQWKFLADGSRTGSGVARRSTAQGRADANQSLERGAEILRAFRAGVTVLGNGDIAERTGLPRSTVSRLTGTLLHAGLLEEAVGERGFRLSPAVIGLGHSAQMASPDLMALRPLMRRESESLKINVGLAAPDRTMMVYIETIRYNPRPSLRVVEAGLQIPMETTSLGRAYLAALGDEARQAVMARILERRRSIAPDLVAEIEAAVQSVSRHGYCAASWQPGILAVATPLVLPGGLIRSVNFSTQVSRHTATTPESLGGALMNFMARCLSHMADIGLQTDWPTSVRP